MYSLGGSICSGFLRPKRDTVMHSQRYTVRNSGLHHFVEVHHSPHHPAPSSHPPALPPTSAPLPLSLPHPSSHYVGYQCGCHMVGLLLGWSTSMGWSRGYHYRERGTSTSLKVSLYGCVFFQWFTTGGDASSGGVFISLCGILTDCPQWRSIMLGILQWGWYF